MEKVLALVPEWSIFPPSANIREASDVVRNQWGVIGQRLK